jgi:hypothetical protein
VAKAAVTAEEGITAAAAIMAADFTVQAAFTLGPMAAFTARVLADFAD